MRHNFDNYDEIVIFHHNDMDGVASYCNMCWAIQCKATKKDIMLKKCALHHIHTGIDSDDAHILSRLTGDDKQLVIILDYAFNDNTIELFRSIFRITGDGKNLLWIDHHDSSIKFVEDHIMTRDFKLNQDHYLVSKAGSGAYLTWAYNEEYKFKYPASIDVPSVYEAVADPDSSIPEHIMYVSDYDTWTYKYGATKAFKLAYDQAKSEFQFFLELEDLFYKRFDTHHELENEELELEYEDKIRSIVEQGKVIENYVDKENDKALRSHGYATCIPTFRDGKPTLDKIPIYAINHYGNSTVFGDIYNRYPYVVVWYFTGEVYKYSIYSNIKKYNWTDCEVIAKYFGGGGHKGAAGWTSQSLMFVEGRYWPPVDKLPE